MQDLLRQVSRSFYLTLRVLPRSVRAQLSLAYLLARASDTVADTQWIDFARRRDALLKIRSSIRQACDGTVDDAGTADFGEFADIQKPVAGQGTPAERFLLERLGDLLSALREFSAGDRRLIRNVLETILQGQESDLVRFGEASANRIAALGTDEELDTYIYQVAGCVGEFWTRICRAHVFPAARMDDEALIADGIRFGKGLQLVNILRDFPRDLRNGRCYIPETGLSERGLKPQDLLDERKIEKFRPLFDSYLRKAEDHLAAGWRYTVRLPFRHARIRLACSWPVLIGMRTLEMLRRYNVLDNELRIHVSRLNVRRMILRTAVLYPIPRAWNRLGNFSNSGK